MFNAVLKYPVRMFARIALGSMLVLTLSACAKVDFVDAEDSGYALSDLRGKYLFVNYWATWCAPCIKEIPELNKLSVEHSDQLTIFGVDFDGVEGAELTKEILKMKIEFPVFAKEPSKLLGVNIPEVLPTTYVFDREGNLKVTLVGPQTEETLLAYIE